jgi:hypothetical protein
MPRFTPQKAIAALMVAYAILVPAAHARPIDPLGVGVGTSSTQGHPNEPGALPVGVVRTASGANPAAPSYVAGATASPAVPNGFDWGDAGIGAGAALLATSLGAGAVVAIRRNRGRGQPALTA